MSALSTMVLAIHYGLIGLLCLFGLHRLSMAIRWFKHRRFAAEDTKSFNELPHITVQVPIYNERFVATRAVDAMAALDYPRDKLQIQIVDDSTDDTSDLIAERIASYQQQGLNISHVQRANRQGFKAGALRDAMEFASGEFIAIFDADFFPEPSLLLNTIHHFTQPDLGMLQFRWEHLNRNSSALTEIQAIMLDAHFSLEQQVRCSSQLFFKF